MLALALTLSLAASTEDYNAVRQNGNNAGLGVLGAWAAASTVTGIVGLATTTDPLWQGVHLANIAWGVVNLGFSVVGLYFGLRAGATREGRADALTDGRSTQHLYSINTAFDVGYMALAALLLNGSSDARWKGFAKASLVQGLFLVLFDGAMAMFHLLNNERLR